MNIDSLTFGELKQIATMFNTVTAQKPEGISVMVGKKCVVRTYSAGVWFGEITEKSGKEVIVKNARRLWQWKAKESISLSAVAKHGINQSESKIAPAVDVVWIEAIELIPASDDAIESIEGAVDAKAQ